MEFIDCCVSIYSFVFTADVCFLCGPILHVLVKCESLDVSGTTLMSWSCHIELHTST